MIYIYICMYDIYIYMKYISHINISHTYNIKSCIMCIYIYNIMRQGNPAHVGNPQSLHTNPYYCSDEYIILINII